MPKPWKESIEEEALEWHESISPDGKVNKAATLNRSQLRKAQMARIERGKYVIDPFTTWLVKHHGLQRVNARRQACIAWSAYEETNGDPVSLLRGEILMSYQSYLAMRSALTRFGTWLGTRSGASDKSREIGRRISNELLHLPKLPSPKGQNIAPKKNKSVPKALPYTRAEEERIYLTVDELRKQYGKRWPWLWPVARIYLKTAVPPVILVHLKRSDATYALQRHLKGEPAGIPIWSRREAKKQSMGGTRIIPASLIDTELRLIVYWPYEWTILADIIAPTSKVERRISAASSKIRTRIRDIVDRADIGLKKRDNFMLRLRLTAIRRLYEETRDLLLLQQVFDTQVTTLKRYPWIKKISGKKG